MPLVHFHVGVVCVSLGAGVAHTHGEAEDEEGGGPAGSGAGLRPHHGGLRMHATEGNSCLTLHVRPQCKYCKSEERYCARH